MDIAGAKALEQRLGTKSSQEVPAPLEVPEDAPPLYRWLGVRTGCSRLRLALLRTTGRATALRCRADSGSGSRQSSPRWAERG